MTSINIQAINKDSFGTKMPNVFIDRVTIENTDDADTPARFIFSLSLKFSKPEHFQAGTAREFIKNKLNETYLYTFLTFKDQIKIDLENNNFSIEQWHRSGMQYPMHHPRYSDPRFKRISFSSLLEEEGPYETKIVVGPEFDESGNEIIELININIIMDYKQHSDISGVSEADVPQLSNIENLMFFAYTGPKTGGTYDGSPTSGPGAIDTGEKISLFEQRYGERPAKDSYTHTMGANSYFSDISYYHVLNKNRIATKFYEAYTTPDDVTYFGEVLQSTNGKLYSTDNYSFADIKEKIESFIDTHQENRPLDSNLDANIKNLEAIINAVDNKSAVLTQLSDYRATYPNKSPTILSGQFYSEFIALFADILQTVSDQPQLNVQMLYDSLVIDNRFALFAGTYDPPDPSSGHMSFLPPDSSGISPSEVVRGTPYDNEDSSIGAPSDCFIPKKWFLLSRKAILTNNLSSESDLSLNLDYGVGSSDADSFASEFGSESDVLTDLLEELTQTYQESGFSEIEAADLARQELSYYFDAGDLRLDGADTGALPGAVKSALVTEDPAFGADYITRRAGDALVRNTGTFMFDYEKAVRSQSLLSHVFNIDMMQKLFRFNVPYEHFYVKRVELSRNEARIDISESDAEDSSTYIRTKMQLNLAVPSIYGTGADADFDAPNVDYPKNDSIDYKFFGGKTGGTEIEVYASKLKYMRPVYAMGSGPESEKKSFLRFINFDLPTTTESARLKNFNSLSSAAESGLGGLVNARVLDGYRLMMFHFSDVMDDDVAYYNTVASDEDLLSVGQVVDGGSPAAFAEIILAGSNNLGEERTCYSVVVEVVDQTQVTYDNFVNHIVSVYNEFIEFYDIASEICNFNNITNEFNSFFKDSISETYTTNKIWITSAYVATALSQLIFGSNASFDEDLFEEQILETITKISPETGNLYQLSSFAVKFKGLLDYIVTDSLPLPDPSVGPDSSEMTPARRAEELVPGRTIQFYNEKPIWEPICGDVTPDYKTLDMLSNVGDFMAIPTFARRLLSLEPVSAPPYVAAESTVMIDFDGDLSFDATTFRDELYATKGSLPPTGIDTAFVSGLLDIETYNALAVFELVFFPRTFDDNIMNFYNHTVYVTVPGHLGGTHVLPMKWEEYVKEVTDTVPGAGVGRVWNAGDKLKVDSGSEALEGLGLSMSYMAFFVDRLLRYSSIDVNVKQARGLGADAFDLGLEDFTGRIVGRTRTYTPDSIVARASQRNIVSAVSLINKMITALDSFYDPESRFGSGLGYAAADRFFSQEYYNSAPLSLETEGINRARKSEMFIEIHRRAKTSLYFARDTLKLALHRSIYESEVLPSVFDGFEDYEGLRRMFSMDSAEAALGRTSGYLGIHRPGSEYESIEELIGYED